MCAFVSSVSKGIHSIYAPNDLLDVLVGVSSPNAVRNQDISGMKCGLMKVQLAHKSLFDLVSYIVHVHTCTCVMCVTELTAEMYTTALVFNDVMLMSFTLERLLLGVGCGCSTSGDCPQGSR